MSRGGEHYSSNEFHDPHPHDYPMALTGANRASAAASAGEIAPIFALCALALMALAGGWLQLPQLAGGLASLPVMTPITAFTFLAGAGSLVCWKTGQLLCARLAAAFVVSMGAVTLLEPVLGLDLRTFLGPQGRMAPHTAAGFVLCGAALSLLETGQQQIQASQALLVGALVLVCIAITGHLLGVPSLYGVSPERGLSLPTALAFGALILGIDARHRVYGYATAMFGRGSGGFLLRNILVVALILPALLAWLRAFGEHAGLLDDASGRIMANVSMVTLVALGALLLLRTARQLDRYERRMTEANLQLEQRVAVRTTQLVQSQRHLGDVLDHVSAFVGLLTPSGTLVEANRAPIEAAGLSSDDVLGKKFWDCYWWNYSAESREQMREVVAKAAQGEASRFDVVVRMAGDTRMWIDFQLAPLRDESGRITDLVASAMDITARKETEKALRASEQRYRALVENTDEGFCILQLLFDDTGMPIDYRFVEINKVFERHTGMHDALGKKVRDLVPGIEQFWIDTYGKVALTGEPIRFIDHAESMGRWFDVYALRIGEPHERKVGVLFNDITDRKTAEAALQEAHRHKDEFLAILGHELRNPLAPIKTGLQVLRVAEQRGQPLAAAVLPMMERQVQHMGRLLDELLDVSRITHGKIELRKEPVDLLLVIQAALETSRPMINGKEHTLEVRLPQEPIMVDADFVRLTQVFANLLNNAAKYMHAGGRIDVSVEPQAEHVVVSVRDHGFGIAPDSLSSIFGMFTQGGGLLSKSQTGLGIGLALVERLVALHGGSVEAHSDGPGKGSEFLVRLPVRSAGPP
jgi:PAS domain S-box-containing protein